MHRLLLVLDTDSWSTQMDLAWHHFHSQEGITRKLGNAKQSTSLSTGGTALTLPRQGHRAEVLSTCSALSLSWHTERESLPGKPFQVVSEDLGSHKSHRLHKICCGKWKHKPQGPDREIPLGKRSWAKQPMQPSPRLHKGLSPELSHPLCSLLAKGCP